MNYLGIDLGTSSIKILLVDENGKSLAEASKHYDLLTPQEGWVEQNPQDWIKALENGLSELLKNNNEAFRTIRSISVTGQMHGIVPIDKDKRVVHNAIIWSDQRNESELMKLRSILSNEEWAAITGNQPNMSFSLGKMIWFRKHNPEAYERVDQFLLPKDYIRMKLTGQNFTDYTDASAMLILDVKEKNWSPNILKLIGDDLAEKLPALKNSMDVAGAVTKEASRQFGLQNGIPVICGCGDAQAQAVGNGVIDSDNWLCTVGTSGQLLAPMENLEIEKQGTVHTLCHPEDGKWIMMGATLSAGMSFKWMAERFFANQETIPALLELAGQAEPGSGKLLFLPYLFGERTPYMDEKAKGALIGLTYQHTKAEICRAVIEGVLFSLNQSYKIIEKLHSHAPETIVFTGGAAQSELWLQTAANIFGKPIIRKSGNGGAAYGAAMIAAVGAGDFADLEEVSKKWNLNKVSQRFEPEWKRNERYQKLFQIYLKSYSKMKEIFHELHDIR